MISFTAKVTKKRMAAALLTLSAVVTIFVATTVNEHGENTVQMATKDDRKQFLQSFGYECDIKNETVIQTIIPAEFDDVYGQYNNLQCSQGFDLSDYKGQTVSLYTIKIDNYGENEQNVYATLLVFGESLIGGDIHSTEQGGFMKGF